MVTITAKCLVLLKIFITLLYECEYFACIYVCASCTCLEPLEYIWKAFDPLEIVLKVVLSHHVNAGNQTQALQKQVLLTERTILPITIENLKYDI